MNRRWRARVEPTFTAELTLYRRRKVGKNSSHSVFGNSQLRIRCDHDLGHARGNLVASSVSPCATAIFQSIRGTYGPVAGYPAKFSRIKTGSKKSLSLARIEQYCSAELFICEYGKKKSEPRTCPVLAPRCRRRVSGLMGLFTFDRAWGGPISC